MSQNTSGYPVVPTATGGRDEQSTAQVARDEAGGVARTAADAGRQVAGTAAEQAKTVAQEATAQARDLVGEARGQVQQQARNGQQKATKGVRALSAELREMAGSGAQQGTVSEVARQVADRAERLADWLGEREPGDLVEEVRALGRRRPGVFLAGATLAGVVVGRLTRGAIDTSRGPSAPSPGGLGPVSARSADAPGYPTGQPGPRPYDNPGAAPLASGGAPPTATPGSYTPPVDPASASGPLDGSSTTEPVSGVSGPQHGRDPLTHRLGSSDPLDEPYRPEYEGPR
jgi:hypothetical protein